VVDEVGLDKVDVLLASSPDTICSHVTSCHQTSSVTEDMDVLASDSADADAEADADADADDQEEDDDASDADDAEEDDDEDADSDADADEANLDVSRRRRSRGRGRTSASQSRMKNGINTGNQALTLSGQIGLLNAMSGMDSFGRPQMGNPTSLLSPHAMMLMGTKGSMYKTPQFSKMNNKQLTAHMSALTQAMNQMMMLGGCYGTFGHLGMLPPMGGMGMGLSSMNLPGFGTLHQGPMQMGAAGHQTAFGAMNPQLATMLSPAITPNVAGMNPMMMHHMAIAHAGMLLHHMNSMYHYAMNPAMQMGTTGAPMAGM